MIQLLLKNRLIIFTFVLCIFYYFGASATPSTSIIYNLTINPSSGLIDIEMEISSPNRLMIGLYLHKTADRVSNLKVVDLKGNNKLHWQTTPGTRDARRIWLGPGGGPVVVTYSIDPSLNLYGRQVGLLTEDFARFRGLDTLYTPFGIGSYFSRMRGLEVPGDGGGQAKVSFVLPQGWTAFGPWSSDGQIPIPSLAKTLLVAGKIETVSTSLGDSELKIGFYEIPAHPLTLKFIDEILSQALVITGQAPKSYAPNFSIFIGPSNGFLGNSGLNSVVATANKEVLAHEIFHWWIGQTVDAESEALWFKEGFTTYYTHRLLVDTGHTAQLIPALLNYEKKLGLPRKINLSKGSRHDDEIIYYYGGALLAFHLDDKIREQSDGLQSLDTFIGYLLARGNPINNNYFVKELDNFGFPEIAKWCNNVIHGRIQLPLISDSQQRKNSPR